MQSARLLRTAVVRNGSKRCSHDYGHGHAFKPSTLNDIPTPSGSWQTQHDANNRRYNMHLALGVGFAAVTLLVAKSSGLVYLNWSPPEKPAE